VLFLYDLPDPIMALTIIGTIVALSYAGYFLFHRLWRPSFSDDSRNVAMTVLTVIATVNSLLLAFVAVSVWESFQAAETAVVEEANTVGELARDLAVFDGAEAAAARGMLRDYATAVITVEWRDMQRGQANHDVWNAFDRMFLAIGAIEPDTPRRSALLPEIWARTNELLKQRRTRLHTSESAVPLTLWAVVLVGTALTIGTMFVLPPSRFHLWMLGMVAISTGLVFHLVVAMDRPFAGEQSINPRPFQMSLENIQRWDTEIAKAAPATAPGGR
jgi:hypothetical protein